MSGGKVAVQNGESLKKEVTRVSMSLGLVVRTEVYMGHRIWGTRRRIDIILFQPQSNKVLGIECKYQENSGTTEGKIYTTIEDVKCWPIYGIVVIGGNGFSEKAKGLLMSTGRAVAFEELENWLKIYFGLWDLIK